MAISILGSFRIAGPEHAIDLTAPRQQIVLAMLLWNANRVVPIERLIDALWRQSPPVTARSQVHICVGAIRKRLGRCGLHGLVNTHPPGYRAAVAEDQLDLHVFDRLVETARRLRIAGRLDEAAERFDEALRMWHGQPFAGIDSDLVRSIATQIGERRLSVVEEYFDLQIEIGRSAVAIGDLRTHIEENPFRERLRAQAIVALCRTGRQVEALREYRETRALFVRELGLEPGNELRRLEREILAGSIV
jgi:DNA-binding SARP family transcriptional activator